VNQQERHIIDDLKKGTTPLPSDDYFTQLKSTLMAQTAPAKKVIPLYRKPWFLTTAAAASILLVVSLFLRGNEATVTATEKPDWSSVSQDEVLAYIHANIDDYEPEVIASHFDSIPDWSGRIETTETTNDVAVVTPAAEKTNSYDHLLKTINKEDILEYLREEAVDMDDDMLGGS
jgi:hypothetical protein